MMKAIFFYSSSFLIYFAFFFFILLNFVAVLMENKCWSVEDTLGFAISQQRALIQIIILLIGFQRKSFRV